MDSNDLKRVIEALIFAADAPLTPERIRETLETCSDEELAQTVETLNREYEASGHAFMIRHVAGGYQVTTRPQFSNWIKKLYLGRQKTRLSQAALESLAIIAFKQPISRVDIAQIRGVNSDAVIGTLLERKLVTISGRSDAVGRPLLYSTTPEFMEFFGINDLAELPKPREIEELIGKEGMPEEVLQALSSDKQLKLPISFEPEAAVENVSLPLLMPVATEAAVEQVEAVVRENATTEELAAQIEKSDEPALSSELDSTVSANLEENAEAAPFIPEEALHEEETLASDALAESALSSSVVAAKAQNEAEPATVASYDDAPALLSASESPQPVEDALPETVVPQSNADTPEPTLFNKKKERKRGKRATTNIDDVDGRAEAVAPQVQREVLAVETPVESFVAEKENESLASDLASEVMEDSTEASNSEKATEGGGSETQAASALEATSPSEIELDAVAIAEDALEPEPDVQLFAVSEVEPLAEPMVVESSATENLKIAAPLFEEAMPDSLPELFEPQVVEVAANAPIMMAYSAAPASSHAKAEDEHITAVVNSEALAEGPAVELDAPATETAPVVVHVASRAAMNEHENIHTEQFELATPSALATTAEASHNDAAIIVTSANDSEAMQEIDSWPEVTEVRVEEPVNFSDELAPIAVSASEHDHEPPTLSATATRAFESESFAPDESSSPEPVADVELALAAKPVGSETVMLAASPNPVGEASAPQVVATPPNGEQMRAGLTPEEDLAADLELRESESSYEEEKRFFV